MNAVIPGLVDGRHCAVIVLFRFTRSTQTVIKPLAHLFKDVLGVSSSAILGSGRVALILDVPALLRNFEADTLSG